MEQSLGLLLNRLKEISSAVLHAAEAHDLPIVLERIAQFAREIAGTKYAALGVPDGSGGLRYFKTIGMTDAQIAMIEHVPQGHGLLGAIMNERRVIRLEKIQTDERSYGFPPNHPPMLSFLGVPIQIGQQLFGMLYLCDKENGQMFNDFDELIIEALASYAALAIAGAEVTEQASHIRLLEERERIGMQLHDGIIQSLYGIGMQVELLRLDETVNPHDLSPIVDSLNTVIEDIRHFILELNHRDEKKLTIYESLKAITTRLNIPEQVELIINAPISKPPFTNAVFESLCLIVNEALSNVVRHAFATRIVVSANPEGRDFVMTVQDNGHGFDLSQTRETDTGGLGLRNMQHRARLYGGVVTIDTHIGVGTLLTIRVPIRAY